MGSLRACVVPVCVLGLFTSTSSRAQTAAIGESTTCSAGMVPSEEDPDHCCWAGQAWSEDRDRCVGTPRCPSGWKAQGSLCIQGEIVREEPKVERALPSALEAPKKESTRSAEVASVLADLSAQVLVPRPGQAIPYVGGPVPFGTHVELRSNTELRMAGLVMLGLGYLTSVGVTVPAMNEDRLVEHAATCRSGRSLSFIPIVGLALSNATMNDSCSTVWHSALGAPVTVVQVLGAGFALWGHLSKRSMLVGDLPAAEGISWHLLPGTSATPGGLSLAGHF